MFDVQPVTEMFKHVRNKLGAVITYQRNSSSATRYMLLKKALAIVWAEALRRGITNHLVKWSVITNMNLYLSGRDGVGTYCSSVGYSFGYFETIGIKRPAGKFL
ncbi:hypothetical protein TNCV_379971 [Trichonephila clavipes]|nr:hypothetical protein TNCV_379971 [Trichonephila clavipes]